MPAPADAAASPLTRRSLPLAPSNGVHAASVWRTHAAVPAPWPLLGGGWSPRARPGSQMPGAPRSSPLRTMRRSYSAAHPVGSLLLGKALACAKERCSRLSCTLAASESSQRPWQSWHVLLRIDPVPSPAAKSRPYPSRGTGLLPHLSLRWAAARLREDGRDPVRICRFRQPINLGGLSGIRKDTARMGKVIC